MCSHVFELVISHVLHTEHKHVLILVTAVTHLLQQRRFPIGSLALSATQRDYKIKEKVTKCARTYAVQTVTYKVCYITMK